MVSILNKYKTSPFGSDLFCLGKKFLVYNLVSRNLKIKYHRSLLGILWTLISPISMALVYYFVFKVVLQIEQKHYLVLILGGVLPWTFFSQTLSEGADSIIGSWGLLSKVPIPLPVFPLVGAITNLVTLFMSIPVLLAAMVFTDCALSAPLLILPAAYFLLFIVTYSISSILSVACVFLRDLRHVVSILLQVWFYATPVIYQESMVPVKYEWVFNINPVGQVFIMFQKILGRGEWPTFYNISVATLWAFVLFTAAAFLHKYVFKNVVERI
jgi:lipopolysaccharide transport system permease protein